MATNNTDYALDRDAVARFMTFGAPASQAELDAHTDSLAENEPERPKMCENCGHRLDRGYHRHSSSRGECDPYADCDDSELRNVEPTDLSDLDFIPFCSTPDCLEPADEGDPDGLCVECRPIREENRLDRIMFERNQQQTKASPFARSLHIARDMGFQVREVHAHRRHILAGLFLALSLLPIPAAAAEIINQPAGLPFQPCEIGRTLSFEDGSAVSKCGTGWVTTDAETGVRTYRQTIDPATMQRVLLYGK